MSRKTAKGAAKDRPRLSTVEFPIPTIGEALEFLTSGFGLRLSGAAGKALQRLRSGEAADYVQSERLAVREICAEVKALAGDEWESWASALIRAGCDAVKALVCAVDTTAVEPKIGRNHYTACIAPFFHNQIAEIGAMVGGPPVPRLLKEPFSSWVEWLTTTIVLRDEGRPLSGEEIAIVISGDAVSHRSWQRWLSGNRISELKPEGIRSRLASFAPSKTDLENILGWFMLARLLQSASPEWRDALQMGDQGSIGVAASLDAETQKAIPEVQLRSYWTLINEAFNPVHASAAEEALMRLREATERLPEPARTNNGYLHDWLTAVHHGRLGEDSTAAALFHRALKRAWWRAGPNHEPLIKDALLHAVLCGMRPKAKAAWDRAFFLKLNGFQKTAIDEMEERRLAVAAEQRFGRRPQQRVSTRPALVLIPEMEDRLRGPEGRRAPNRVSVVDESTGLRRTPFMLAFMLGETTDVATLLDRGGDFSTHIPETGENALHSALRDAIQTRHLEKLHIALNALPKLQGSSDPNDGWDRGAGEEKERPIALAIKLGEPWVVQRLLDQRADPNKPCRLGWPPLYYTLLTWAWRDPEMAGEGHARWLAGEGEPSIWDARAGGAVFGSELAETRASMPHKRRGDPLWGIAFDQIMKHSQPPLTYTARSKFREIVRMLLHSGAKPNEYVSPGPGRPRMTPTLFAAQVGDGPMMDIMLQFGGNPSKPILDALGKPLTPHQDAYTIAFAHKREAVLDVLAACRMRCGNS